MTMLKINQHVRYVRYASTNSVGQITNISDQIDNEPYPYYVLWYPEGSGWYRGSELTPLSPEEYQQIKLDREDQEKRRKHADKYL